jgi:hypothetical protein
MPDADLVPQDDGRPDLPAPIEARATVSMILADYFAFLKRWQVWVADAADEAEATRRLKARNDAARAALNHLEQFRKVAAQLGAGASPGGPASITEWRALMPPQDEEEPMIDDEHGPD